MLLCVRFMSLRTVEAATFLADEAGLGPDCVWVFMVMSFL
jgi:hypothetical protein